jgi:hypothetical protein
MFVILFMPPSEENELDNEDACRDETKGIVCCGGENRDELCVCAEINATRRFSSRYFLRQWNFIT